MMNDPTSIVPKHVAIIMDGNGRWARRRAMPRQAGHRAGVKSVRKVVETAAARGVACLTLFAFSSENWARPKDEVSSLMKLFFEALRREVADLHRNNVKLSFIGARQDLQPELIARISEAETATQGNSGMQLIIAVAYGGRWDIVNAAISLARKVRDDSLQLENIDETAFASELQLAAYPDPDLLIRTGGEQRISNFLLWNLAYAELYFSDKLWPEFGTDDFNSALEHFSQRQRRFGHTGEQVKEG